MITKLMDGVAHYLASCINKYNITTDLRYDPKMDLEEAFKRLSKDVATDTSTEQVSNASRSERGLIIYSREALRTPREFRSTQSFEGLVPIFNKDNERTGTQINRIFPVELNINFKVTATESRLSDLLEMILVSEICKQTKKVSLDVQLSKETRKIEDIEFTVDFTELRSLIGIRNTNMRELEFSCRVVGPLILPLYSTRNLYDGDLSIWVFNKSVEPTNENTSKGELVVVLNPPTDAIIN